MFSLAQEEDGKYFIASLVLTFSTTISSHNFQKNVTNGVLCDIYFYAVKHSDIYDFL